MQNNNESLIYFLCYPKGDRSKITVIDLHPLVSYERDDWINVNDSTFSTAEEAIKEGRKIAKKYNLTYEMFESRYNESTSEKLILS